MTDRVRISHGIGGGHDSALSHLCPILRAKGSPPAVVRVISGCYHVALRRVETHVKLLNDVINASRVHCLFGGGRPRSKEIDLSYGPPRPTTSTWKERPTRSSEAWICWHTMISPSEGWILRSTATHPEGVVRPPGNVYTPLVGTAWHLWAVGTHYELTDDQAWLRRVAPPAGVALSVDRQTDGKDRAIDAGAAEGARVWSGPARGGGRLGFVCVPLHDAQSLLCGPAGHRTGLTGHRLQRQQRSGELCRSLLRINIVRAYQWSQARTSTSAMPSGASMQAYADNMCSPSLLPRLFMVRSDFEPALSYDVECGANHLGALGVLNPKSQEISSMLDHLENEYFLTSHVSNMALSTFTTELEPVGVVQSRGVRQDTAVLWTFYAALRFAP